MRRRTTAEPAPGPVDPDTPPIFVPLLELEALAPGSWYLNVLATDMRVEQRSLEDVFLDLTGRELRS